jgi:hypothetical protein
MAGIGLMSKPAANAITDRMTIKRKYLIIVSSLSYIYPVRKPQHSCLSADRYAGVVKIPAKAGVLAPY